MTNEPIRFLPWDKACVLKGELTLLELALRNRVPIGHSCGGMGSCATCRVIVVGSNVALPERGEVEQEMADMRQFRPEERLACQLPPIPGLVVEVPSGALDGDPT